jgi:hypothetical protein
MDAGASRGPRGDGDRYFDQLLPAKGSERHRIAGLIVAKPGIQGRLVDPKPIERENLIPG